jgi:RHS repeat-associated protein
MQLQPRDALPKIMLARYYSGSLGRFLSVDPKPTSARRRSVQSWNRYSYAANNPIVYADLDGRDIYNTAKDPVVRQVGDRLAGTSTIQRLYGPKSGRDLHISDGYLGGKKGLTTFNKDTKEARSTVAAYGKTTREMIEITTHELGHAVLLAQDADAHDADPNAEPAATEAGNALRREALQESRRDQQGDENGDSTEEEGDEEESDEKEGEERSTITDFDRAGSMSDRWVAVGQPLR